MPAYFDHHSSNGSTEAIDGRAEALRGNALGAHTRRHGAATIWSYDRDLRKFNGITVRDRYGDCPVCRARLATATIRPHGRVRNSTIIAGSA